MTKPAVSSSDTKNNSILGLDLVRIVAAALVLTHHLAWWEWAHYGAYPPANIPSFPVAGVFAAPGWVGVAIFFVLSGYVIAFSAARSKAVPFLRNRFIRLFPTIWVCCTLTAFVRYALNGESFISLRSGWLRSMTMFAQGGWIDPSYWTLRVEIIFYLLLTVLLSIRRFHWLPVVMVSLSTVSILLWLAVLGERFHMIESSFIARLSPTLLLGAWPETLLLREGCFFSAGVFLWLITTDGLTRGRSAAMALSIAGGALEVYFHADEIHHLSGSNGWIFSWTVPLALWLFSLLAIACSVIWNERIYRFAGTRAVRVVRLAALLTYPVYLLHQTIGFILMHWLHHWLADTACLAVATLTIFAVSYLVHRYGEVPLQTALRSLFQARSSRRAPAASLP